MSEHPTPPASAEELRAAILARYDGLSKRLKQIARYILDEPNAVALETLAVLSERCGVQPSAIVRFAKSFGFDGATQMQRLFRDGLLSANASLGYGERVREFSKAVDGKRVSDPSQVLAEFVEGNMLALQHLGDAIDKRQLTEAVKLIAQADTVYVAGFRRSFPVAAYLAYSLHQVDKKTVFIDSVGGMTRQQIHGITRNDLLLVVSYQPYAEEAVHLIDAAVDAQCKVLSISDSPVSPVAKPASLVLQVREAEIRKFRSLSTSMCLAQALVISYAFSTATTTRNASTLGAKKRTAKK
ncbi:MurR/RpiR family transcriptional regulator [Luteimonas saliphila]|uniref:MurR/RpiR family transcriptional regulator n=1 Tax=Luteimonas saliphila TaxID=2804919 RepID=UPI00192E1345|nr:MurR/RpiR family transcriptional regulator [Luteimonas saliphila]